MNANLVMFSTLEREVLKGERVSDIKVDELKKSVAANVDDAREWDRFYLTAVTIERALQVMAEYSQELKTGVFTWWVPMAPSSIVKNDKKQFINYHAVPERFEGSTRVIWDRLRRDVVVCVDILQGCSDSKFSTLVLESLPKFYVLKWRLNEEDPMNRIYLHKGTRFHAATI